MPVLKVKNNGVWINVGGLESSGGVQETATDDDVINALVEADLLCVVTDENDNILTDELGNILLW
jgi:hypothetical protein